MQPFGNRKNGVKPSVKHMSSCRSLKPYSTAAISVGCAACRTQQQNMECQQRAVQRAAQHGQRLSLLPLWHLDDGTLGYGEVSSLVRGSVAMSDTTQEHFAVAIFCGSI